MKPLTYDIGDRPRVTGTFRDLDNDAPFSPSLVTAKLVTPDGVVTTLTGVAESSTGVFVVTLPTLTQPGEHIVKYFGTGTLVAAEETSFLVRRTKVT